MQPILTEKAPLNTLINRERLLESVLREWSIKEQESVMHRAWVKYLKALTRKAFAGRWAVFFPSMKVRERVWGREEYVQALARRLATVDAVPLGSIETHLLNQWHDQYQFKSAWNSLIWDVFTENT